MGAVVLKEKDICAAFPGDRALEHVGFHLISEEIHGLGGANGAGRSTLMNVLADANPGYRCQVRLDGRTVEPRSPAAAHRDKQRKSCCCSLYLCIAC